MLGANFCMPLLYMSKSYIWLEETNEYIDHPSIKNDRIDSQSHEKSEKDYYLKKLIKYNRFGFFKY